MDAKCHLLHLLQEDLLPMMPAGAGMGMVQLQALLTEHGVMKEARERRCAQTRSIFICFGVAPGTQSSAVVLISQRVHGKDGSVVASIRG